MMYTLVRIAVPFLLSLSIATLGLSQSTLSGQMQGCSRSVYRQVWPEVVNDSDPSNLFFGLMMSFGGDYRSHGAVPAVQVALEQINNDSDLLPGYTLHYALLDSQVCDCACVCVCVCVCVRAVLIIQGIISSHFLDNK